jgi:hypothetical protein
MTMTPRFKSKDQQALESRLGFGLGWNLTAKRNGQTNLGLANGIVSEQHRPRLDNGSLYPSARLMARVYDSERLPTSAFPISGKSALSVIPKPARAKGQENLPLPEVPRSLASKSLLLAKDVRVKLSEALAKSIIDSLENSPARTVSKARPLDGVGQEQVGSQCGR